MTSFANLINRCETAVNDEDNSSFTSNQIIKWLNDGIRDLSQHFPRVKTQTISCSAADKDYDLAVDFMGVLSVEYPTGQDPQEYLSRRTHTQPDFWSGDYWYDVVARSDDTDQSEIWISKSPAAGESIDVIYHAHHELITDAADASEDISVLPSHQHILVKYVQWQAVNHLAFAEMQSPTSNSSLLMAQLAQNARRSEIAYHTAIQQALYAADGQSRAVDWLNQNDSYRSKDNSLGRVY